MNHIIRDKRVFRIHHADSKARPEHYYLEEYGSVTNIIHYSGKGPFSVIEIDGMGSIFDHMETQFLKPNRDGFCYYMAELPDMEQYLVNFQNLTLYKVPTKILKDHMKSYKSPF